jgi:rpsU-divergently transcribed protein
MTDLNKKIIKASLLHIRSYGFSERAIIEGCHLLGLSSASKGLIPNNELSLVHHVLDQAYSKSILLAQSHISQDPMQFDTQKVAIAVKEYIMNLGIYADFWDEAMLILARPNNLFTSLEKLKGFSEDIYREAVGVNVSSSGSPVGRFFNLKI